MDCSRVPLYDDDSEKGIDNVINARVLPWLLLVMFNYCSELTAHVDYEIVSQVGIDGDHTVNNTRTLGGLLIKITPEIVPARYTDGEFNINNCPLGWLDFQDVEKIWTIVNADTEQVGIPANDKLLFLIEKAVTSKQTIILGHWFN